ncbi:hypothetical protein, partial [Rhodopseudomonas palustris]|uniref:hypothetical protein n=1 Tax=Rhodopseudomonas palustris TaxID=1076 RepID=UPI003CC82008
MAGRAVPPLSAAVVLFRSCGSVRLEHAAIEIPQAHAGFTSLRIPSARRDRFELLARFDRRDGQCVFRGLQPNLHIGMIIQRHQSPPLIAVATLQLCRNAAHLAEQPVEFRYFSPEQRIVLCQADLGEPCDEISNRHILETAPAHGFIAPPVSSPFMSEQMYHRPARPA